MTTGASAFLDTNVLLRATIAALPLHREATELVAAQRARGAALWISRQVIREYLVVVTRPQSFLTPLPAAEVDARARTLQTLFHVADDTARVTAHLLALLRAHPTGGKQIHDANIVATMLAYGIGTLLTFNRDDMARFGSKIALVSPV
jgi:predicted nucleic acid-binding protein